MFPQFVSTARSISRATALLTRVGTDAHFYDEPETEDFALLLDSKYEAEKMEGMKRLIALMSQGKDVSNFFPQVVKNVVTDSLELKKLVYVYLIHYAEKRPDEALLAMNTFQKDLSDLNPLVRAWALRSMSGIRVRVVLPLVVMAIKKCARDPSPYVRRCAAHAMSKVYSLDREQHVDALEELICLLINDNSPGVIGAVAAAFTFICPEKLSFWGPRFQKLCELLPSVDEWGQVVLTDILLRNAIGRHGYPKGSIGLSTVEDEGQMQDGLQQKTPEGKGEEEMLPVSDSQFPLWDAQNEQMGKEEGSSLVAGPRDAVSQISDEFWLTEPSETKNEEVPKDVDVLLQATLPLLWSNNSAVVLAAACVHWLLASDENVKRIVKPVIFLLRSSVESQYVVLANIATFARKAPSLFEPYHEEFFIISEDAEQIRAMKLDILCLIASESSIQSILEEFQEYIRDPDRQFAADTVRAIGHCALRLQTVAKLCTKALLVLAKSGLDLPHSNKSQTVTEEEEVLRRERLRRFASGKSKKKQETDRTSREAMVVTEAVMALRTIVHKEPVENEEILVGLARWLDRLKVPAARTIVIWMVGEFGSVGTRLPEMVPIILQYLGGSFMKEADETKLQILNCAVKVVLRSGRSSDSAPSRTPLLILDYVLRLAEVDLSYDIRDRARWYKHLLAFHLQNVPQQGTSGSSRDLSDKLIDLNVQESNTDQDAGPHKSVEGQAEGNPNLLSPKIGDGKDEAPDTKVLLLKLAENIILIPKPAPILPSLAPDRSVFVPGTMSHIVMHRAPNYLPLPTPFSIELRPTPPSPDRVQRFGKADADLDPSSDGEYSGTVSDEGNSDQLFSPRSSGSFYEEGDGGTASSGTPVSSEDEEFPSTGERLSRNKSETRASSSHGSRWHTKQGKRPQQELGPLINLSDPEGEEISGNHQNVVEQLAGEGASAQFGMLSAAELDLWLGSSEPIREETPSSSGMPSGYATVSIGKVEMKPKMETLLDFTNGGGLDVKYCFERVSPMSTETLLSMKLFFGNRSLEALHDISVSGAEFGDSYQEIGSASVPEVPGTASPVVVSDQAVSDLQPGGKSEGKLSVYFRGHLKPIKLTICCSGKSYPVKLTPAIGALIKPALLSPEEFSFREARITGMHEALRRCILIIPPKLEGSFDGEDQILLVARVVAQRVLSSAHVSLVSTVMPIDDSVLGVQAIKSGGLQGLCLQFSGETLTGSVLCLIRVTVLTDGVISGEGGQLEVLVKINCEDAMFGSSLLQELSKALNSSD